MYVRDLVDDLFIDCKDINEAMVVVNYLILQNSRGEIVLGEPPAGTSIIEYKEFEKEMIEVLDKKAETLTNLMEMEGQVDVSIPVEIAEGEDPTKATTRAFINLLDESKVKTPPALKKAAEKYKKDVEDGTIVVDHECGE